MGYEFEYRSTLCSIYLGARDVTMQMDGSADVTRRGVACNKIVTDGMASAQVQPREPGVPRLPALGFHHGEPRAR